MLLSLALDYQAADVATRERFHVSSSRLKSLYARLADDGVAELGMIATCNRTELYAWCPRASNDVVSLWYAKLARRWMRRPSEAEALLAISTRREGLSAARHLMRVAVGLESQILGDGQILGQFRTAYGEANDAGVTGPVLHRLFESALRAAKRVHTSTLLGSGANSIGAQAAALAARRFGNLAHTRIVIVGCGKTGERAARQLAKFGARDLVFINRSPERARELASEMLGRSAPLDTLHAEIAMADIAFVATGAEVLLVKGAALEDARTNCHTSMHPLLLVDLSMPRNVDPKVASQPGVTLVDLDVMQPDVSATEQARRSAVPGAEVIVEAELLEFADWLSAAIGREAIRPLREALADVCRREVALVAGDEDAERIADRIVAKMMARPMNAVRVALARGEPVADLTRALNELFSGPVRIPYRAAVAAAATRTAEQR